MSVEKLLIERGLLTVEALDAARRDAAATRSPVRDVLLRQGVLTEEMLAWHLADAHELPFVHLMPEMMDARLAQRAGAALLRTWCAMPLQPLGGEVTVVVADPETTGRRHEMRSAFGGDIEVQIAVAQESKIRALQDRLFGPTVETGPSAANQALDDASGVLTLYAHLAAATRDGADELRFDPTARGLAVRVRRGGEVVTVDRLPDRCSYAVGARARLLLDGAYSGSVLTTMHDRPLRLEIEVVPTRRAEAVVIGIHAAVGRAEPSASAVLGEETADRAVAAVLAGPIVLVAGPDERSRRLLARSLARHAGAKADPVVVVEDAESSDELESLSLAPADLERAVALRARVLLVTSYGIDAERLRAIVAAVPSLLVAAPQCSASVALALCPPELRPLVRAAVCPEGLVEAQSWT